MKCSMLCLAAAMKRSIVGLAAVALLTLAPGTGRAETITMTITFGSHMLSISPGGPLSLPGSTNTLLQVDTNALNTLLANGGSALSVSNLIASSNFPGTSGSSGSGTLSESGSVSYINTVGITSITISTSLSGYVTPTGTAGTLTSTYGSFFNGTTAGDTQTSSGSLNSFLTTPHTFTSTGPAQQPSNVSITQQVGPFSSGYSLDNSVTVSLDSGSDSFNTGEKIESSVAAAPEPASLTMLGIGAIGLLGYGWRRRSNGTGCGASPRE